MTLKQRDIAEREKRDALRQLGFTTPQAFRSSALHERVAKEAAERSGGLCEHCGTAPATTVRFRFWCVSALRGDLKEHVQARCQHCVKRGWERPDQSPEVRLSTSQKRRLRRRNRVQKRRRQLQQLLAAGRQDSRWAR